MLNFSKINILTIYLLFFIISIFSLLNFQNKENLLIEKKINLGLDLQGGSYLLLEINSDTLKTYQIKQDTVKTKSENFTVERMYATLNNSDAMLIQDYVFNKVLITLNELKK